MKKIILVIMVLIIILVTGCTSNKKNTFVDKNVPYEAKVVNGVQEVKLSWGKFNYNPQEIIVKEGIPVNLNADLDRLRGCFNSIRIPDLGVSESFSETNPTITFTPKNKGTFSFSCSMGMGKGIIKVT